MIVEADNGREYGTAEDIGQRLIELGHANGPGLIHHWRAAGHLTPIGYLGRRPLYAVDDVMRAELATRKTKTRRGGATRLTSHAPSEMV